MSEVTLYSVLPVCFPRTVARSKFGGFAPRTQRVNSRKVGQPGDTCGPLSPYSGRDCVKSLRSSYTGLYRHSQHESGRVWQSWTSGLISMNPQVVSHVGQSWQLSRTHQFNFGTRQILSRYLRLPTPKIRVYMLF